MGETPPEPLHIDIISHTETVKPKGLVAGIKRAASSAAKTVGLDKTAEKLNPDVTMNIENPLDPDTITISESKPPEPQPPMHPDEIVLVGEATADKPSIEKQTEEELTIDVSERQKVQRVVKETPTQTTIIGEEEKRPGFERVIMEGETLRDMTNFMRQDMSNETGGFLVGQFCQDPQTGEKFTQVLKFLAKETGTQTWGSFNISPEDMANILSRMDVLNLGQKDELRVVGWVHSHPAGAEVAPQSNSSGATEGNLFGDRQIMKNYFSTEGQITLIYGTGSPYDNQYAVWRPIDNKAMLQKGFEVENAVGQPYGYYNNISELPFNE